MAMHLRKSMDGRQIDTIDQGKGPKHPDLLWWCQVSAEFWRFCTFFFLFAPFFNSLFFYFFFYFFAHFFSFLLFYSHFFYFFALSFSFFLFYSLLFFFFALFLQFFSFLFQMWPAATNERKILCRIEFEKWAHEMSRLLRPPTRSRWTHFSGRIHW